MSNDARFYHDPDGSKHRARERRIAELMAEAGPDASQLGRCYWELVHDHEHAPMTTDHEQLVAAGLEMPCAGSLDDAALEAALERLLRELERMHVEVFGADERTPRDLYTYLTETALHDGRPDVPMREGDTWVVDASLSGDCEDEWDPAPDPSNAPEPRALARRSDPAERDGMS